MLKKNKRKFKRRENQSECEIRIDRRTYKGRIVDYSDGICATVEKVHRLVSGTLVEIKLLDSEIELKGEVAWVEEFDDYIKFGFKRIGDLKGSLKDFKLADILNSLQRNTKTGVLQIKSGSIVKKIFIKHGDVIFAVSDDKYDRLGELLLREGRITPEKLKQADEILKKTGERLGKILVDLGHIEPTEFFQIVRHQVEKIIFSLFIVEDGEFEFQEGIFPTEELITLRMSIANLIYRGVKQINNMQYLQQVCPPVDAVLNFSQSAIDVFQHFTVEDTDKKILSYVNGKNSIKKILSLSPSNELETLKTIYAFLSIGLIEVKEEAETPVVYPIEEIVNEPDVEVSSEFTKKIENMLNKINKGRNYYNILGVSKDASFGEIKEAAYRLLKKFHPDRRFSLSARDTTIRNKLNLILSSIINAYNTLHDPEKRKQYNKTLSLRVKKWIKKLTVAVGVAAVLVVAMSVVYENFNKGSQTSVLNAKKSKRAISEKKQGQLTERKKSPEFTIPASYSLKIIGPETAFRNTNLYVVSKNFDPSKAQIQWLINGVPVFDAENLKFKPQDARKGDIIQARATIQDKEILSNAIKIKNAPPEIIDIKLLPEVLKPGDTLSVEANEIDIDGDAVTFSYEWMKNGEYVGNSKKVKLSLGRGDNFSIKVTPFDGEDYGKPVILYRVVLNMPPVIIKDYIYNFDGKVFNYQVRASDLDNDPLTYSLKSAPSGMTINPLTGLINWNVPPDFKGKASFVVSVTDGNGAAVTQDLSLTLDTMPVF